MGTAIVLILLLIALFFIIRSMIEDKKKGRSLSCGGDCKNCRGCHKMFIRKNRRHMPPVFSLQHGFP